MSSSEAYFVPQYALTELAVGEALVSFLDDKGRPSVTERGFVLPPSGQLGSITPAQRKALLANSLVAGVYEATVYRESAYERLKGHSPKAGGAPGANAGPTGASAPPAAENSGLMSGMGDLLFAPPAPGVHSATAWCKPWPSRRCAR